jgi:hypothetical protein
MTLQQPDIQWYIARDGKQHGPLSDVEMRTFVGQGHLRPTDLIWRAGFADWRPAPAVFPFQSPEPQRPAFQAPQNGSLRAPAYSQSPQTGFPQTGFAPTGFPQERSFEPERIHRASSGGPSWATRIVGGLVVLLLIAGGGGWFLWQKGGLPKSSQPAEETARQVATVPITPQAPPPASVPSAAGIQSEAPAPSADAVEKSAQELDRQFQQTTMWTVVKREFPDWYSEQLRATAKLAAQNQPQTEISKQLAQALVELRRKHADQALSASTDKLKLVANAFLANLKDLSEHGVGACYGFISQGETSPAVSTIMLSPQDGKAIQAQITAIFEAIADGRRSPRTHDKAVKSDYEVLVQQLTKLGWKENDLKIFSNPTALSHEPPQRVCQMVQDWFSAHLAVQDKAAQERLLVETLKPVVSG